MAEKGDRGRSARNPARYRPEDHVEIAVVSHEGDAGLLAVAWIVANHEGLRIDDPSAELLRGSFEAVRKLQIRVLGSDQNQHPAPISAHDELRQRIGKRRLARDDVEEAGAAKLPSKGIAPSRMLKSATRLALDAFAAATMSGVGRSSRIAETPSASARSTSTPISASGGRDDAPTGMSRHGAPERGRIPDAQLRSGEGPIALHAGDPIRDPNRLVERVALALERHDADRPGGGLRERHEPAANSEMAATTKAASAGLFVIDHDRIGHHCRPART